MAYSYTRQSTMNTGDVITVALFNNEFNQLVNGFAYSSTNEAATGHRHDGSAAQGGSIHTIGDMDFKNKIVADSTGNAWGFFVEVAAAPVEQIRLTDGVLAPVTDDDVDLGTASLKFKDVYFNGNLEFGSLDDGTIAITGWADEDDMSSDSATLVPTQQSVKAFADAMDLDFAGDSGGTQSTTLNSETLTIAGGTGIDTVSSSDTLTVNIDSTVVTLTGTQVLTNKTLTAPTVTEIDLDGGDIEDVDIDSSPIGQTTPAAGGFTDITVTGTVDGRDVATDGTKLDTIETSADVTDTANVTAAGALMDSEVDADIKTLSLPASTTISTFGASLVDDADANTARTTLGLEIGVDVNAFGATMNTDTDVSGNSWVIDEDDMASNSSTKVPTQQSVKNYAASFSSTILDFTYPTQEWALVDAGATSVSGDLSMEADGDTATLTFDVSQYIGEQLTFGYDFVVSGIASATGGTATISSGALFTNSISGSATSIELEDDQTHTFTVPGDLTDNELVVTVEKTFGDDDALILVNNVSLSFSGDAYNKTQVDALVGDSALSLTVNNATAVAGVSYPNTEDALEYADTVLAYGAPLTLNYASGTAITDSSTLVLDNNRYILNLQGDSGSRPTLNLTSAAATRLHITGTNPLTINDINFDTGNGKMKLEGTSSLDFQDCNISGDRNAVLEIYRCEIDTMSDIDVSAGDHDDGDVPVEFLSSRGLAANLTVASDISTGTDAKLIRAGRFSQIVGSGWDVEFTGWTGTNSIGIYAEDGSTILYDGGAGSISQTGVDSLFDPSGDAIGNVGAVIYTS